MMANMTGVSYSVVDVPDKVLVVASRLLALYQESYHQDMDEMKFHKLMYFAQRESFIQSNKPLFNATFYGWRYGPILKEIRSIFKEHREGLLRNAKVSDYADRILQMTLQRYGKMSSWELSSLSHGEISWKNSRIGVRINENSDNPINILDIAKDAERVKKFRNSTEPIIVV